MSQGLLFWIIIDFQDFSNSAILLFLTSTILEAITCNLCEVLHKGYNFCYKNIIRQEVGPIIIEMLSLWCFQGNHNEIGFRSGTREEEFWSESTNH